MLALLISASLASPLGFTVHTWWWQVDSLGSPARYVEEDQTAWPSWGTAGGHNPLRFDFDRPAESVTMNFRWGREAFMTDVMAEFTVVGTNGAGTSTDWGYWPLSVDQGEGSLTFSVPGGIRSIAVESFADGGVIIPRDGVLFTPAHLPEPATLALVALGMAAMGWRRLRARG